MAILNTNLIYGEKPEFGNKKHIVFIKEKTKIAERGEIEIDVKIHQETIVVTTGLFEFDCFKCGHEQSYFIEQGNSESFKDHIVDCDCCDQQYRVNKDHNLKII